MQVAAFLQVAAENLCFEVLVLVFLQTLQTVSQALEYVCFVHLFTLAALALKENAPINIAKNKKTVIKAGNIFFIFTTPLVQNKTIVVTLL